MEKVKPNQNKEQISQSFQSNECNCSDINHITTVIFHTAAITITCHKHYAWSS